jgi:hypothetical protein
LGRKDRRAAACGGGEEAGGEGDPTIKLRLLVRMMDQLGLSVHAGMPQQRVQDRSGQQRIGYHRALEASAVPEETRMCMYSVVIYKCECAGVKCA